MSSTLIRLIQQHRSSDIYVTIYHATKVLTWQFPALAFCLVPLRSQYTGLFEMIDNLPPRSPDATPCDFFLWDYVKYQLYVPPLTASIPELKVRIRTAIETITADMLQFGTNSIIVLMFVG